MYQRLLPSLVTNHFFMSAILPSYAPFFSYQPLYYVCYLTFLCRYTAMGGEVQGDGNCHGNRPLCEFRVA